MVQLDVFDGPLDLLLQLVLQQDLDITQVSLASVCSQYLTYLSMMQTLDIDVASGYLVIAATLTFIKSKKLLPPPPSSLEDEAGDEAAAAEDSLRRQLLAYQHFKTAGNHLRERFEENSAYYARQPTNEGPLAQRFALDAARLAAAFAHVLQNPHPTPLVIKRDTYSVLTKMRWLLSLMRERGSLRLFELAASSNAGEIVVTFLALLELIRAQKIGFKQVGFCQDILFMPLSQGAVDQLGESA